MDYPIEITGKTIKQVTKLNLSNLGLTEIPENVFLYTNLTKLTLSGNQIRNIPKDILKLRKLKTIDLSKNEIKTLQSALFKLPNLRTLNLYCNNITALPKQFYDSSITCLIVGHNRLTAVDFKKLHNIESLDLTYNQLTSIHIGAEAKELKVLRIKGNSLENCSIDQAVRNQLSYIDVDINKYDNNKLSIMKAAESIVKKGTGIHHIFISYSHDDAKWLEKLKKHLKGLKNYYDFDEWDDQRLKASDEWEKEISEALEHSTIAICLVSASFMASDYIMGNELPHLFNKANHNGTKIIPLMVSACGVFEDCWLSKYQAAGSPQKTLSECTDAEVERRLANLMRNLKELIK